MRDILSKVMTGSMIAGAALLVSACGGSGNESATNNTTANGLESEPMYNDMGMDNGLDAGLGNASDMGNSGGMTGGNTTGGDTGGNATNGM
jgi:hypothetical protein